MGDVDKLSLRYKGSCSLPSLRIDSLTASPAEDADESAHLTIGKIEKMPGLDNDLTFEDGSVSIAEFLNVTSLTVRDCTLRGVGEDLSGFADAGDISDWAADALSWAVAEGVFNGSDQGLLDPGREITRAECCAILMNWELRAR